MARRIAPPCERIRRQSRLVRGLAAAVFGGTLLAACGGSSSGSLAHQACVHVQRSLSALAEASAAADSATRAADQRTAANQIRAAIAPAALAATNGGQWQALAATIAESSTLPESYLVVALTAECAAENSGA